jgi:hypothetical protein
MIYGLRMAICENGALLALILLFGASSLFVHGSDVYIIDIHL